MTWLTSQTKRQARFNLQLKFKNPLSSFLFHLHYRYTINKITWCIFNLIQNHQPGAKNSQTQRNPDAHPQSTKGEGHATHHTAVVGKNHFLCYKAWQLLPTYSLFCREGRMSQTRPVQSPYHLICDVLSFCISMTVASAASASTATNKSEENLCFKLTNTSYCSAA